MFLFPSLCVCLVFDTFCRIEEAKRAIKRSAPTSSTDNDRYSGDIDRKRSASDRRFEPPPPPRFDTAIRSSTYDRPPEKKRIDDYPSTSSKRNDDYKSSTRGNGTSGMGSSGEVSSSFKRPLNDYPKRGNELDMPSRSTNSNNAYDNRGAPPLSSAKDHRFNEPIDSRSSGANFGRSRADERDMRYVFNSCTILCQNTVLTIKHNSNALQWFDVIGQIAIHGRWQFE